jgi:hypothetical protein
MTPSDYASVYGYRDRAITHINGDIHDNRPENLRVVTLSENRGNR